ncbi:MAG TPA: hypothetical protein VFG68_05565 [Fimbriiglobus sp.]|nr:hypothetical protein [Fimbriiglobus sp.]
MSTTTPTLTDEQSRAVAAQPGEPLRLIDPVTNRAYVLLRADLYDKVRELLQGFSPPDAYPAIDRAFATGWDDPRMDDYDRYEELRK